MLINQYFMIETNDYLIIVYQSLTTDNVKPLLIAQKFHILD